MEHDVEFCPVRQTQRRVKAIRSPPPFVNKYIFTHHHTTVSSQQYQLHYLNSHYLYLTTFLNKPFKPNQNAFLPNHRASPTRWCLHLCRTWRSRQRLQDRQHLRSQQCSWPSPSLRRPNSSDQLKVLIRTWRSRKHPQQL